MQIWDDTCVLLVDVLLFHVLDDCPVGLCIAVVLPGVIVYCNSPRIRRG